ncbi:MAG: LysR family transcriptional regulator [Flavonifractor plautii]
MDMKQLEIFVTACERGSFSQAAACMYMTQPNISKSIRALEHELGRPLLIRNAKGVQPTAYGKIVLEHATDDPEDGRNDLIPGRSGRAGQFEPVHLP